MITVQAEKRPMTIRATQVRYTDGSTQWLRLSTDEARALPDVVAIISCADASGPYGVTNWSTRAAPFTHESINGEPWHTQRDPNTGHIIE
jgi:hypothetical protein